MRSFYFIFLIANFVFLPSCQQDSSSNLPSENINKDDTALLYLLFFKKEKVVELWQSDKNNNSKKLSSYPVLECRKTPIGIFKADSFDGKIKIEYPNDYYSQKATGASSNNKLFINSEFLGNGDHNSILVSKNTLALLQNALTTNVKTQVFIFPNDARNGGEFEPCFGCPHFMGELYSSLELHLEKFHSTIH